MRTARALAAAFVVTIALVAATALGAGHAAARVAPGKYTYTTESFGQKASSPATVRGNVLTLRAKGQPPLHLRLRPTPVGGYADFGPARFEFKRGKGGTYHGTYWYLGIPAAAHKLVPRR